MATSPHDLELALRIRADLDEATRKLQRLDRELKKIDGGDRKAAGSLDATAKAADRQAAAIDKAERAARSKARANSALEQSERRAERAADRTTRALASQARQLANGDIAGAATDLLTSGRLTAAAQTAGLAIGGLTIAVLTTLKALDEAQREQAAYDNALIRTGGHVGRTREELADFAAELDKLDGVTSRSAAKAVAQIAASGQFAGEQFELATRAAVLWSSATGESIDQTIAEFEKIRRDPVAALLELNKTEHNLTQTQLDRIDALLDEGREQEAVTEAFRIHANTIEDRAPKIAENLSVIQKLWKDIKGAAAESWDEMIGVFRGDQINALRDRLAEMAGLAAQITPFAPLIGGPKGARTLARALFARPDVPDFSNVRGSAPVDSEAEEERRKADEEWQRQTERFLSDRLKMERDIAEARELGLKAGRSEAEIEKQIAAIRKTYADRAARGSRRSGRQELTDAQRADQAAQRELANLERQIALLGDVEDGETKASEAARIRFETEEGGYRLASPERKQELLDKAQLLDTERMRIDAARRLVDVQLEIARLQGRGEAAELQRARTELGALQADLESLGKTAEAADVAKLLNLRTAAADLEALQRTYDQTMGEISLEQQRIQVELQAGLLSEGQAQQQIVDLYNRKLGILRQLVPQMRAAALALGDPAVLANVNEIEIKLQEMATTTNLLQQAVGQTFEGAFSRLLTSLATNTASLGEAVRNFFVDMAQGLAQFAAQQLAAMAAARLMQALTKSSGGAGGGVAQGAKELGTAALATGAAGVVIQTGASTLATSAAALQSAATTLLIANSLSSTAGFASGGYTGDGGKYQVAGVVHRGEGVLNQGEIRALGGPSGFYALRRAIAAGSLPIARAMPVYAPTAPRYSFAKGGMATAGLPAPVVNVGVKNYVAPKDIGDAYFDDPDNDATIHNWMTRNGYRRHGF